MIALKAALDHQVPFPFPVRMLFVDHRSDRFEILQKVIAPYLELAKSSKNVRAVEPVLGDCDEVINRLLDENENNQIQFGPALAFLDQFGYGDVSMQLICRIMSYPRCEIFSYLNYKDMNRFIADAHKYDALSRTFGGDEWRDCVNLPEKQRREGLLKIYKAALKDKDKGNAKYVVSFLMFDKNDIPLYWLFFCTNNIRGLEEMKKAMWVVDETGEFRFSDSDAPSQLRLLNESFDDEWLSDELVKSLAGKKMTAAGLKEHVLVETPCYLFKGALSKLEDEHRIRVTAPAGRRAKSFPDDSLDEIMIRFEKPLL